MRPAEDAPGPAAFMAHFVRWARRVRTRLIVRSALSGGCAGLVLAALAALACWYLRADALRPWTAALGVGAGAALGTVLALRRRWSDRELALYLDAKLAADELISSALEVQTDPGRARAARELLDRANTLLERADARRARPAVWQRRHWFGVAGSAAVTVLSVMPLPAAPLATGAAPGATLLQKRDVPGLDRIIELEHVRGRDAEQTKRLKRLAEEARRLRAELAQGMERREALARLAKLRDDVAAEQLSFGNEQNRAGLEAAVRELERRARLGAAAEALGNGDLVEFDRQMQQLAREVEQQHRKDAKDALEEAKRRAKEAGAKQLEGALGEHAERFERREAGAQALRELAEALGDQLDDEARRDLEEFGATGDPEALRRFQRSLEDALGKLSPEQRKRLAERLKQRARAEAIEPMTEEQLEELARRLESEEGRKQLLEQLERMAREGDPEADRQRSLDDAERGGAEAQRGLGVPLPMPGGGQGAPGKDGASGGQQPHGGKAGGKSEGGGQGDHSGSTPELGKRPGLIAKAETTLNPGVPMHGAAQGRTASRPGETAKRAGEGALGSARATELGAVEHSDVPEEYREHVGRYFEP